MMSSLTNFALSIYVVHTLGAAQFGAFSLAYVTYGFALNASRGLSTDPLMVRFSGMSLPVWRRAVADCTGTAVAVGLATGALVLAAAGVLHGAAGAAFLALGLTLPGLLLQDSWRYSFIALGRGSQAFLNDTIWALTLLPALALLRATGHASVFWFVFAWGATAAIAAAAGPWQAGVMPRLSGNWRWLSRHRDLGPRYVAEGCSSSVSYQLRSYGIGLILGLSALGSVQASFTLFGPVTVLFFGMSLVAIPEAARVLRRSPRRLPLFCMLISAGLAAAGVAWGVMLLIAVPRGLGSWLLGPIWRSTYPLLLPQMLTVIGVGIGFGVGTGLHAHGASRRSLRQAVLVAALYVTGSLVGALAGGAAGSIWGGLAAPWIGAVVGWWQLHAVQRESGHLPAGRRFWPIHPSRRHDDIQAQAQAQAPAPAPAPAVTSWPDLVVLGGTARHDPTPKAVASYPAVLVPPVPAQSARREKIRVAGARVLLATGCLALLAPVSVTGWTLARDLTGTHRTAEAPARTNGTPMRVDATGRARANTYPRKRAYVLKPVSAMPFDPFGDGQANTQLARLAIDGNPGTAWHTESYASAAFGNLKPGTGLLLDMGKTVTITSVRVLLGRVPGADFRVRVGAVASLPDLPAVAHASDVGGQVSLHLARPAHGRYVLVWFTQLPPSPSGTFQASVFAISLKGWA